MPEDGIYRVYWRSNRPGHFRLSELFSALSRAQEFARDLRTIGCVDDRHIWICRIVEEEDKQRVA